METLRTSLKKVNMTTIKARGGETCALVQEKIMTIDWHDIKAEMKDFNVELVKPINKVRRSAAPRRASLFLNAPPHPVFFQARQEGVKAYLRSTFTLDGPQVGKEGGVCASECVCTCMCLRVYIRARERASARECSGWPSASARTGLSLSCVHVRVCSCPLCI